MKNIIKIMFSFAIAVMAVACADEDNNTNVGFSLGIYDTNPLEMNSVGGKEKLLVETNESWVATVNVPWLRISPSNGVGTTVCEIFVDSSLVNDKRETSIRFTPDVSPIKNVVVRQFGFEKIIAVKEDVINIESSANIDKRFFETEVTTNVKFKVECDFDGEEWLSTTTKEVECGPTARPQSVKLRFDWKMNTVPEERKAEIRFVPVNESDILENPAVISVLQKPAVKIEDNRAGDSIALIVINEKLNCWSEAWDTNENMQYWSGVKLWEKTDKELPSPDAVGRVRSVEYFLLKTEESIPAEIKHLKYLESLSISSNTNTMLLNIDLGPEVCSLEHLKNLRIFAYGLVSLPDEFVNLKKLEVLDLSANNFNSIPEMLTQENFPNLKSLNFVSSRRYNFADLRKKDSYDDGVGLYLNTEVDKTNNALRKLLLWDTLEELALSNCYMEGSVPDFTVGEEGVVAYTKKDVDAWGGDTIQYLADNHIPKILPKCSSLRLNLNFFTGKLPDWLLYHPYLLEWGPEVLIFNQYEKGINTAGDVVGFDNVPQTFDYYYDVFPGMREKYELKEEVSYE
ncbi:MAG: hypothetical protein IKA52_04010 [Bacteroidaceae bacterium]|nr:hypothetical protein [Bacteroidaceae bacterium]